MKISLVILLALLVGACRSGGGDGIRLPVKGEREVTDPNDQTMSISSMDLSGTWLMTVETRMSKIETGEYLSSRFSKFRYVFDDTENGVKFDECWTYGSPVPSYGIKTDTRLYMNLSDSGFTLQSDGSLKQTDNHELNHTTGFSYENVRSLVKLSDDIEFDGGMFVLSGPVSIEEHNQVCVLQSHLSIGLGRTIIITVPYDEEYISLNLEFFDGIDVGVYEYENDFDSKEVILRIGSRAKQFEEIVGNSSLFPSNVSLNIAESTSQRISGSYSFTGYDSGLYEGQFEVFLND